MRLILAIAFSIFAFPAFAQQYCNGTLVIIAQVSEYQLVTTLTAPNGLVFRVYVHDDGKWRVVVAGGPMPAGTACYASQGKTSQINLGGE